MNKLTPIPTEFLGVRYRSKSEAMFAAVLHYLDKSFRYEPLEFGSDAKQVLRSRKCPLTGEEYIPSSWEMECDAIASSISRPFDFLITEGRSWREWNSAGWPITPHDSFHIVEYKPSRPSATYLETFAGRFMYRWINQIPTGCIGGLSVYYGNLFDGERGLVSFDWTSAHKFHGDLGSELIWHELGDWDSSLSLREFSPAAIRFAKDYRYDLKEPRDSSRRYIKQR